jgi:hypothetical protein
MSITEVSAGDTITAANYNQIKNHLEGATGSTLAYFLRVAAANNFVIRLSDNAGAQKFSIQDSDGVEIASIDSDGDFTLSGSYSPATLVLPNSAGPAPTTEGDIQWDSDDHNIVVGDSSGTQTFRPLERIYQVKIADETVNNSTTLQSDDTFTFTATANSLYMIEGVLRVSTGATPDIKFQMTIPGGQADGAVNTQYDWNGTAGLFTDASSGSLPGALTSATAIPIKVALEVTTGGTVALQWAQNTADASDTKVLKNSWWVYERIGAYTA